MAITGNTTAAAFDALIGMQNASSLMARAAQNVTNAFQAASSTALSPVSITSNSLEDVFNSLMDSQTLAASGTTDPTQGLIDLLFAKTAFAANAKSFSMANQTQQSLLDILA